MKNLVIQFIVISLFLQERAVAQKKESLQNDSVFTRYADTGTGFRQGKSFYITNKINLPPSVRVIRTLPDDLLIVAIDNQQTYRLLGNRAPLATAKDSWKLSPMLEKRIGEMTDKRGTFVLTGLNIDTLLAALQSKGKKVTILSVNRPTHSVVVACSPRYMKETLLGLKEVIFLDAAAEPHPEARIIGYDRSFHGINTVDFLIPGANGKNIVAGVKEQRMDENDIDLRKRVLPSPLAANTTSQHATVIASIIGGAGNSGYQGKGLAWACSFFPSSFSNLFADDETFLEANNVSVQNHSYGTVIQQFYGAEAVSYDLLAWKNKSYVPVMSAGNQGEAFATEGQYANLAGFANLTGNFKMAKNVITVGAIDNKENIPAQSSAGPLYDGRLAPQLTALGPNGTSDAAAIVSGTVAVMQQVYANSNSNALPPASLIKAILYNTADDIYRMGIDYKTGYGLLNSYAAIKAIEQKKFDGGTVQNGEQWTKAISVPANIAELKITLAWTDSAASVNNNKAIGNDLDLDVIERNSGAVYQPWVLNTAPNADSLAKLPTRKRDSLNTAEQVSIRLPGAGDYQVRVTGTAVGTSPVPFHLSYKLDTLNTFRFTSPLQGADATRNEFGTVAIRWKTFVADSAQRGDLFISYDNGTTWQPLAQTVRLLDNHFSWQAPDTAAIALLKMETAFGNFLSPSFVVSNPTRVQVEFNCADSFLLSWNKHFDATTYRIYTLTDSTYLKPVLVSSDTAILLQRTLFPSRVYAVEPVLNSGLPAPRSAAQDIDLLGVNCFYRTLNYYLLDQNHVNILVELSAIAFIDSVFFENVSAAGELLQIYGSAKVVNNNSIYTQAASNIRSGVTYLRGRIKLKNGTSVYTDIVPVLTSGKKIIWFYPIPAQRNGELNYVLQQGIPTSSKLQFFDVNGRLLQSYSSMPDKIVLSGYSAGMVIYKLLSEEGETLETGKLLILR
jgi:hypothetical protein